MSNKNNSVTGLGLLEVLQLIFIVLKLVGVINWSWPIVLIPLWVILGVSFIGIVIISVTYLLNR